MGVDPTIPVTQPPVRPPAPRPAARRFVGPLVLAGAAALKWGKAALLLAPKAKVLTTSATMLVSVAAYALIWGWRFAVGFVALLFVHEMGHVIQLRREGVRASAPMFVPFLGAFISARSLGDDALAEARVGLAGPVLGSLAAATLVPVGLATGEDFWLALAFTGFLLNLFNLLPVLPLDGGRAMAAMAPWMWFAGFAGLIALTVAFPNPILVLVLVLGGLETWRRWQRRRRGGEETAAYYRVAPRHRAMVAGVYLALVAGLAVGMHATFVERTIS